MSCILDTTCCKDGSFSRAGTWRTGPEDREAVLQSPNEKQIGCTYPGRAHERAQRDLTLVRQELAACQEDLLAVKRELSGCKTELSRCEQDLAYTKEHLIKSEHSLEGSRMATQTSQQMLLMSQNELLHREQSLSMARQELSQAQKDLTTYYLMLLELQQRERSYKSLLSKFRDLENLRRNCPPCM
jgi:chromosome segregation ATPase